MDDRRVRSGIVFVNRNGLRWRDAPPVYGSHKALYKRWHRWSHMGVFGSMLMALAKAGQDASVLMLDATHLKLHRTAASLRARIGLKAGHRMIGRTKDGLNSKLHVVADAKGRPVQMLLTAGHRSDYLGALADERPPSTIPALIVNAIEARTCSRA